MTEKLLTIEEVSEFLHLSEEEIRDLVAKGDLPAFKIGGVLLRFKQEHVENYRKKRESTATAESVLLRNRGADDNLAQLDLGGEQQQFNRPIRTKLNNATPYTFMERLEDFFYYNDFYILSVILLALLVFAILQF
jgi:excisionase family DNA binding protein